MTYKALTLLTEVVEDACVEQNKKHRQSCSGLRELANQSCIGFLVGGP